MNQEQHLLEFLVLQDSTARIKVNDLLIEHPNRSRNFKTSNLKEDMNLKVMGKHELDNRKHSLLKIVQTFLHYQNFIA